MILTMVLVIVGFVLGGTISADLSNHPMFPTASYAFVIFWMVFGGCVGFWVGEKISYWLDWE